MADSVIRRKRTRSGGKLDGDEERSCKKVKSVSFKVSCNILFVCFSVGYLLVMSMSVYRKQFLNMLIVFNRMKNWMGRKIVIGNLLVKRSVVN